MDDEILCVDKNRKIQGMCSSGIIADHRGISSHFDEFVFRRARDRSAGARRFDGVRAGHVSSTTFAGHASRASGALRILAGFHPP